MQAAKGVFKGGKSERTKAPRTYKVVLLGPYRSGKSSILRAIVKDSVCVEHDGSSVSLDFGCMVHGNHEINFFGTPGKKSFQFMQEVLAHGADAYILVIDSSDANSLAEAKHLVKKLHKGATPFLVAANKQDLPASQNPKTIQRSLGATGIAVVGVVARTGEGLDGMLRELLRLMEVRS